MPLRAVLFDLDGTLLNRRETFRCHIERQVARLADVFAPAGAVDLDRMIAIDDNGNCPRGDFYRRIESEFGLVPGASSRLLADFEAQFPETCIPAANLYVTLEALRSAGLRLGLITNGRLSVQGRKVDGLDIRRFLEVVLISESIGVRKPDPRIFAEALFQMGVSPASAMYVGDNPEVDVVGAKRSGLLAIWKRDRYWAEPEDVDGVIDDLVELLPLVLGRGTSGNSLA
jgi:putative hydrolase of the HAD superfamily